jgi:pimeloyl-ACP methyl ester carboxylesterase
MSRLRLVAAFAVIQGLIASNAAQPTPVGNAISSIEPTPCAADVAAPSGHCFRISVPENYRSPNGRRIQLDAFVLPGRTHATGRAAFFLAGGPGERATRVFAEANLKSLSTGIDVVIIDQRGTGTTPDIRCQNDTSPANLPLLMTDMWPVSGLQSCLRNLAGTADLTQYTTRNAVEDLEQSRQLLGYRKIDIIGYSYGTRLALEYMRRHGANVRSATLSGPFAPEFAMPAGVARHAQASQQVVIDKCLDDASCRRAYPDLRDDLAKLEHRLDAEGVAASVADRPVRLKRGIVASYIRTLLYRSETAAEVPYAIHVLASEDPGLYTQKVVAWRVGMERAGAWGLYLSITCTEDFPLNSPTELKQEARGTLLGDYRAEQLRAACAVWPAGELPRDLHLPLLADIPTLVLSGVADPITPPVYGERIVEHLRNSRLLRIPNGAHINFGDCIDGIIVQFIETADPAKPDSRCLEALKSPPFKMALAPAE